MCCAFHASLGTGQRRFHIIVQYFAHCWYFVHIVTHCMQAPATTFPSFTHTHVLNYIALLDRSLSLTQVPAETGALIFLCGGDQELYDSQATYLDAMGKVRTTCPIHCYFIRVAWFLCFIAPRLLRTMSTSCGWHHSQSSPCTTSITRGDD
jgi:hypothetical protein